MADLIIKPASGGDSLIFQDGAGAAVVTVSTNNVLYSKGVQETKGTSTNATNAMSVDLATGNFFEIDLQDHSADIHSITINESLTGTQVHTIYLKFTQGSYGRKFIWSAITNIKWPNDSGPVMTGTDNSVDILKLTTYESGASLSGGGQHGIWIASIVGQNFS